MNSSGFGNGILEFQDEWKPLHCSKDALTDFFGWLLQAILCLIAFSCLICKFELIIDNAHLILNQLTTSKLLTFHVKVLIISFERTLLDLGL